MTNEALGQLAGLDYPQLQTMLGAAVADKARLDGLIASINAEIVSRLEPSAKSTLANDGKDYGTCNLPLQGGMVAKATLEKKIEWDSDKLMAIARTMPWDQVTQVFKIAWSVPEKIYAGLKAANPELGAKIDGARTVKPGRTKIELLAG